MFKNGKDSYLRRSLMSICNWLRQQFLAAQEAIGFASNFLLRQEAMVYDRNYYNCEFIVGKKEFSFTDKSTVI
ncbi:MAG: hypothetical protein IPL23_14020 [Saprospiraceae bacterium]|nr:hypothetical protein [Saprospiraceae bacterium]